MLHFLFALIRRSRSNSPNNETEGKAIIPSVVWPYVSVCLCMWVCVCAYNKNTKLVSAGPWSAVIRHRGYETWTLFRVSDCFVIVKVSLDLSDDLSLSFSNFYYLSIKVIDLLCLGAEFVEDGKFLKLKNYIFVGNHFLPCHLSILLELAFIINRCC